MNIKFLTLLLFLMALPVCSQVGINTTEPQAALDITASSEGVLIPRIELTDTATPIDTPTVSELVYNTATQNDVTPGFYYWDGGLWVSLSGTSTNELEDWQAATLLSPWVNTGNGFSTVRYYKENGRVYLSGRASGGSHGDYVFFLPEGYRPDATLAIPLLGDDHLYIDSSGQVRYFGFKNLVFLDGISFRVD